MEFKNGRLMAGEAHRLIPGGCHTYAKGDDQFPKNAPPFIDHGKGCHAWDLDGNEFIEYGMGLRSVTLGHAYEPVVAAAHRQMKLGNNYTRPAPIEVQYAKALLSVLPGADMVKFSKDGSTVTTAAIKLARAYTRKDLVAYCRDHPFFSYNDWFMGTTPVRSGIPDAAVKFSLSFRYNDIDSLKRLFDDHPGQIGCVIMEPEREDPPKDDFLQKVRDICTENDALLIFDEMITGFRWAIGGGQEVYDVIPDLATFGKAMANGFALSALVGKSPVMELGGLYHDKERVFLLSTTHGAENHALAAALATLNEYQGNDVIDHLHRQGARLKHEINAVAADQGVGDCFRVIGRDCNLIYLTRSADGRHSPKLRTLMLQELIRNGVIAPSLIVSYSHADEDIDKTVDAFEDSLKTYRKAIDGDVDDYLTGTPVKSVYRNRN